jgi:hypothetical protein
VTGSPPSSRSSPSSSTPCDLDGHAPAATDLPSPTGAQGRDRQQEPVADEAADAGQQPLGELAEGFVEEVGERGLIAPTGSSPSQAPTRPASAVPPGHASEAAALPQQHDRRVLLARAVVTLLRDVRRRPAARRPAAQSSSPRRSQSWAARQAATCSPTGSSSGPQQLLDPAEGRDAVQRAAQRDEAEPDRLDLAGGEVVEPRLVERPPRPGSGSPPSRIHSSAYCAGSCSSRCTTQPSSRTRRATPRPARPRARRRGPPSCPAAARRRRARAPRRRRSRACGRRRRRRRPASRYV